MHKLRWLLLILMIFLLIVETSNGKEKEKKISPKVNVRDDGVLLVDGKPFYPVGAYRDPRDTLMDFRALVTGGFNLTHSYYFEEPSKGHMHNAGKILNEDLTTVALRYLRVAHRSTLKVFLGIPRKMVKNGDLEGIKNYVLALKSEPALLVWYLLDEPGAQRVSPKLLRRIKQTVEEADPEHPTFVVFCRATRDLRDFHGSYDIAGFDYYPIRGKKGDVDEVRKGIEARKEQIGRTFPFWHIVQAHDFRKPKKGLYYPSPRQIRCMTFLGIISGARGTIYYWWPSSWCDLLDFPDVWEGICSTVKDLRELSPILTERNVPTINRGIELDPPDVFPVLVRRYQRAFYIFIVNPSEKFVTASVRLPAVISGAGITDILNHKREIRLENNNFRLALDSYGVSVLKVE